MYNIKADHTERNYVRMKWTELTQDRVQGAI